MIVHRRAAVATAAVALIAGTAASASASIPYQEPTGKAFPQIVVAHGNRAVIFGNYSCTRPGVLWASVKEGGGHLTEEGSSSTAKSWYDTHVPLTCDGRVHNIRVVIHKEPPNEGHPSAYRNFIDGQGYVQWCVTDSTFDFTSGSTHGLSSYSRFLHIEQAG
jgi:hypothetical protein